MHRIGLKTIAAGCVLGCTPLPVAAQDGGWTPLEPGFSSTGDPYISVPNGSSGAPRQGWLNTADGFFTREAHLAYSFTEARAADTNEVLARFNYPLTRRLWIGTELPFYRNVDPVVGRSRSGVGDATVSAQFMIAETQNLSLNAGVGIQVPLGDGQVGGGVFAAVPQINLWTDLGSGFSFRGRVAYAFPDSRVSESLRVNAAIGQTSSPHDAAPFGDATWYLSANWVEPANGRSFVSITPGMRTHVGGNLFFLAGIEFPLTDTRNSFRQRFIVQLVQGF